ncbi:hypothetical protein L1987_10718 [Smallanthus sonchifolius]|uniref:Uncharacterized protein n=1 Tax=Smallanthus sonchifolius TaxID=185202 RepID=A0ACB9JB71_9ASTR|nr:hypothetical protein L1987_10718 [Smallanthus sonchifolius]
MDRNNSRQLLCLGGDWLWLCGVLCGADRQLVHSSERGMELPEKCSERDSSNVRSGEISAEACSTTIKESIYTFSMNPAGTKDQFH